jgi:hypothetical protein
VITSFITLLWLAMTKAPRKPTPSGIELQVLDQSRRRCTLCFHLKGDLSEKHGQIAHLDDNPANYAEDNLAFMCMEHHSLYDSTTSQHKNYTVHEAKAARARLHQAIANGEHITGGSPGSAPSRGVEADRQTLARLVELMMKTGSIDFLRTNNFAGWSFDWSRLDGVQECLLQAGPEHEFLDVDLEQLREKFRMASHTFMKYTAANTFVVGTGGRQGVPEDWEVQQPERFKETVKEIHEGADAVCGSYDELIRAARRRLAA